MIQANDAESPFLIHDANQVGWEPEKSDIDTICQDTVKWFDTDIYKSIDIKKVVQ